MAINIVATLTNKFPSSTGQKMWPCARDPAIIEGAGAGAEGPNLVYAGLGLFWCMESQDLVGGAQLCAHRAGAGAVGLIQHGAKDRARTVIRHVCSPTGSNL